MLAYLFVSYPLPNVAPIESQVEAPEESIAAPATPVQTKRSKLSMVWHKEFDGKRERMVAHWVTHAVGREC